MTCDVTNYVFSFPVAKTKRTILVHTVLELLQGANYESVLAAGPSYLVKEIFRFISKLLRSRDLFCIISL